MRHTVTFTTSAQGATPVDSMHSTLVTRLNTLRAHTHMYVSQ